jgi:Tol biopolymer transport system component
MALAAGAKLGSYEVVAPIGAGGMGEVYQAHDTKLGRDVAIKVLPGAFAHDPERLARFQREAKMLASLNHPNIATIHGLEQSGGTSYLVMELVSGETLQDRVKSGPLGIDEALKIAVQIAEALEAAHEKGIIHRDLKPANVKVTPEGKVKVLDFGLAKAFAGDASTEDIGNSPTLSRAATMQGVILGTAAYMSPEQAKGKAVDKRTDIWAFGAVLYELLTGKPVFHGEDITDILAAVVRAEPDWDLLPPSTSMKIRDLLRRCLQKDKNLRMQAAGDARIEICEALAAPLEAGATRDALAPRSKLLAAAAVALAIIATVMAWGWWRASRPVEQKLRPLVRLDVDLGPDVSLPSIGGVDAIISPDGMRVVYASEGRLSARRLDQPKGTELSGTQGASQPFFSPDWQWVAFFSQGKLRKVSVDGGAAVSLCDADVPHGGSWGEDGIIIVALAQSGGLWRVPDGGGTPQRLTMLDGDELGHRWPQILPGDKTVLFTAISDPVSAEDRIETWSLKTGERKVLLSGGSFGRYVPTYESTGHLLYSTKGTLFAVPFDPDRLVLRGTPSPLLNDLGAAEFDFSSTGTFVYRSGKAADQSWQMLWLDSSGKTEPIVATPGTYADPRFSPDGKRLALITAPGREGEVVVYDLERETMTHLSSPSQGVAHPTWTPDGKHIVFRSRSNAGSSIVWIRSDGSGEGQKLLESANPLFPDSFSPDGRHLAYDELDPITSMGIWTLPLDLSDPDHPKPGKPEPFLRAPRRAFMGKFSPDGRWIAYSSNESGANEVYVRPFPAAPAGSGGKWQISNSGGSIPTWSRDGRQLFYERPADDRIMVVDYTARGDSFVAGKPRVWSDKQISAPSVLNLDLHPDGKRFAVIPAHEATTQEKGSVHFTFLLNFFDELQRKLPVAR